MGFIAARQRLKTAWPTVALVLIAWMGATAQIHASRTTVPGGLGHISMNFFTVGPGKEHNLSDALLSALVIFTVTAIPYLIWRFEKSHSVSA